MITTLILDADGVLINGQVFAVTLEKDLGLTREATAPFFRHAFQDCLVGTADLKVAIAPFLPGWGWHKSVDEFMDYWFTSEHSIDEPLIEYIQRLRNQGVRCIVATNQEHHRTQYMLEKMGFADSFDAVISSAHLGHVKPAEAFFEKLLDSQRLTAGESLFWDNTEENVEGARTVGLHAEIYTDFEGFKETMKGYTLFQNR